MSGGTKLRAAVIGLEGHPVYAERLIEHPRVEPVAIAAAPDGSADRNARCREMAKQHRAPFYEDRRELLDSHEIDVCAVLAPWRVQPDIVADLAARAVHAVAEKPIAGDRAGAERLAEAVRRSGIRYTACLPMARFSQPVLDAMWMIRDGKLGEPLVADFTYLATQGPLYIAERPHYRDADLPVDALSGGEAAMFSGYGVVALEWLTGRRITHVHARAGAFFYDRYQEMKAEDLCLVLLRFEGGCVGRMLLGRVPCRTEPRRFEIDLVGADGAVQVSQANNSITVFGEERADSVNVDLDVPQRFIDDFIEAVRLGREPAIGLDLCLDTIAVLEALYRSAASGRMEAVRPL